MARYTKEELVDFFPYHVLQIPYCEADDVIGVLTEYLTSGNILIISGDKDFQQKIRLGGVQDIAWALANTPAFLFNR